MSEANEVDGKSHIRSLRPLTKDADQERIVIRAKSKTRNQISKLWNLGVPG